MIIKGIEFKEFNILGNGTDLFGTQKITARGIEKGTSKVYLVTYDALYGEKFDLFTPEEISHHGHYEVR